MNPMWSFPHRFDVRDSHYFESFLVDGVCTQLSSFTVGDVKTLLSSLLAYRCPYPTEPEPFMRFLKTVSGRSADLDASTLVTLLVGSCSSLGNSEIARVDAQELVREMVGQLVVKSDETGNTRVGKYAYGQIHVLGFLRKLLLLELVYK